jgi:Protein of unknown function (DUF732)
MSTRQLLAVVTIAIGTATALAAPASADAQTDQAFLNALAQKGIHAPSDAFAISLAHSTCDTVAQGNVANALQQIISKTKWPQQQAVNFGGLAIAAYCPGAMPGAKSG